VDLTVTERRFLWAGTALAGLLHLLAPGVLLSVARAGYRALLDVEFTPQSAARRRVRVAGVGLLALAAAVRRYLDD
jgi:hypothetical protein